MEDEYRQAGQKLMKAELQRIIQCSEINDWEPEFTICIISAFVNCWEA